MRSSVFNCLLLMAIATGAAGQTFDSGSDGSDGSLTLTTAGTVTFTQSHRDNVYRFRTITIARGVTVRMSSRMVEGGVVWLSQGPVQIDGNIDLSGEDSVAYSSGGKRIPNPGGAGGYVGGVGISKNGEAEAGDGTAPGKPNQGGRFTGNTFLIPLAGGSGGGGTSESSGGGGGGALLIASSASITVNGTINANGGNQNDPGFPATGGSGGAIRLAAPVIGGSSGTLTARGGAASGGEFAGGDGRIRIEAFENSLLTNLNETPVSVGKPFKVLLPPQAGASARIVRIAGASVADSPVDSPVKVVNSAPSGPRAVVIEGRNVAPGTEVRLRLFSEAGPDQSVSSTPLSGSRELSQATTQITLPNGTTYLFLSIDPVVNGQR